MITSEWLEALLSCTGLLEPNWTIPKRTILGEQFRKPSNSAAALATRLRIDSEELSRRQWKFYNEIYNEQLKARASYEPPHQLQNDHFIQTSGATNPRQIKRTTELLSKLFFLPVVIAHDK